MITPFHIGVKAIIEHDGKVLLLRRSGARQFWEGPGGRMNDDETPEQTLRRELKEELPSITNVRIGRLLYVLRLPGLALGDKGLFLVWYRVQADFTKGVRLSDEHDSYRWCSRDEVAELASEGVREAVEAL